MVICSINDVTSVRSHLCFAPKVKVVNYSTIVLYLLLKAEDKEVVNKIQRRPDRSEDIRRSGFVIVCLPRLTETSIPVKTANGEEKQNSRAMISCQPRSSRGSAPPEPVEERESLSAATNPNERLGRTFGRQLVT